MKCPICGAWSLIKDTRQLDGYTNRRHECANNHRFSTKEFPWVATNKDAILKQLKRMRDINRAS